VPKKRIKIPKEKISFFEKKSINDLIIFALFSATRNNEKCTFEQLLKECFLLFPNTFSFPRYPQWPDSRKLDRPLRTLRSQKLIKGSSKTYFCLTAKGKKKAQEIAQFLKQKTLL